MKETFKILSGIVQCPCKQGGCDNAHIMDVQDFLRMPSKNKNVQNGRYVQIAFWFECGHTRVDHYRSFKGTTYCETHYSFDNRDCYFPLRTPKDALDRFEYQDEADYGKA
jgi:hypothetical protein